MHALLEQDYMKEDACGQCRSGGKIDDYKAMQSAIDATGSSLILTIEGQPPFPEVADGSHGNARRVGHDISPHWLSMTSLVDTGSGLWSFAHNDSGKGGWWNDLDVRAKPLPTPPRATASRLPPFTVCSLAY